MNYRKLILIPISETPVADFENGNSNLMERGEPFSGENCKNFQFLMTNCKGILWQLI